MTTKCHFIGIGGIGMSGLARLVSGKNIQVTGSDLNSNYITESLKRSGINIFEEHSQNNISTNMTVVYSTDIKKDNPEYQAALSMQCRMLHRSELLAELMQDYQSYAVTGTHGKTTTSSLLAWTFYKGGLDPSFVIGGLIPQFESNARQGLGKYFIAEADESDGTFLRYHPHGGIVTNIGLDHLNYFGSEENLINAFETFFSNISSPDSIFWCGDDARLLKLNPQGISYGFSPHCQLRALNLRQEKWKITYDVTFEGTDYTDIEVSLIGKYNALNSLAVFGTALKAGISESEIRNAFKSFEGVVRRCEKKGEIQGILLLDDYAHHPTEIAATLKAIKEVIEERRLIAVFQPHRYSRTQTCLGTYNGIFKYADELIITDLFGAGEAPIPGVTYLEVLQEIQQNTRLPCRYIPRDKLATSLCSILRPHDVMVSLGAGDITKLSQEIKNQFLKIPPQKLRVGVVCGGRSSEHEISLLSAVNIYNSLNTDYYEVFHFGITKSGEWISGLDVIEKLKNSINSARNDLHAISPQILCEIQNCDVMFPILHGPYGEDGMIQGFFDVLGKPYVGCDHRSSAVCMDKALTKQLAILNNIATSPFLTFSRDMWRQNSDRLIHEISLKLQLPIFVKPSHLGSGIGVTKIDRIEELSKVLESVFLLDTHVVVENGLHAREIEFAVLGDGKVKVFPPGEVYSNEKIYDYENKYGENCMECNPQSELSQEQINEGMGLAQKAYQATGCNGFARVDFFLDRVGKFWLNEINPIPGFTKISLFPQICASNGLKTTDLMDKLIVIGLQRWRHQQ